MSAPYCHDKDTWEIIEYNTTVREMSAKEYKTNSTMIKMMLITVIIRIILAT